MRRAAVDSGLFVEMLLAVIRAFALSIAFRSNTALKALYRRFLERGKDHMVALPRPAPANSSALPIPSSPLAPGEPSSRPLLDACCALFLTARVSAYTRVNLNIYSKSRSILLDRRQRKPKPPPLLLQIHCDLDLNLIQTMSTLYTCAFFLDNGHRVADRRVRQKQNWNER